MAWEVLIPVAFGPLEEFEVVLHFTFDEGLDGDDAVDAVSCEGACSVGLDIWVFRRLIIFRDLLCREVEEWRTYFGGS